MLGATRQSVNKELKQLEEEGLISLSYGIVVLRDPDVLRSRARSDSTPIDGDHEISSIIGNCCTKLT